MLVLVARRAQLSYMRLQGARSIVGLGLEIVGKACDGISTSWQSRELCSGDGAFLRDAANLSLCNSAIPQYSTRSGSEFTACTKPPRYRPIHRCPPIPQAQPAPSQPPLPAPKPPLQPVPGAQQRDTGKSPSRAAQRRHASASHLVSPRLHLCDTPASTGRRPHPASACAQWRRHRCAAVRCTPERSMATAPGMTGSSRLATGMQCPAQPGRGRGAGIPITTE